MKTSLLCVIGVALLAGCCPRGDVSSDESIRERKRSYVLVADSYRRYVERKRVAPQSLKELRSFCPLGMLDYPEIRKHRPELVAIGGKIDAEREDFPILVETVPDESGALCIVLFSGRSLLVAAGSGDWKTKDGH